MRVNGWGVVFSAALALLAGCGSRTGPWSFGAGEVGGASGAATGSGFGVGSGGIATGSGGIGVGGTGAGTGGVGTGAGGTDTGAGGTGASGTGAGGTTGTGTGAGGTGTGGTGTGAGGAGTGAGGGGGTAMGGTSGSAGTGSGGRATGGNAGTGATGGGAGTGGTGGSSPDASAPCLGRSIFTSFLFEHYFLLEKSASMGTIDADAGVSRWRLASDAVGRFLAERRAARAAMGFFPQGTGAASCAADTYATPTVPFSMTFMEVPRFVAAMQAQTLGGDATTAPALAGALRYTSAWANVPYPYYPTYAAPSVILMTDGPPDTCDGTIAAAVATAAASFASNPRIKTFVVALGPSGTGVDPIAAAGGTSRAFVGLAPFDALERIEKSRVMCDIELHDDRDAGLANARIYVQWSLRAGDPLTFIRQVSGPAGCGAEGGWFLEPANAPKMIMLCPDTCRTLADNEDSRIVARHACDP